MKYNEEQFNEEVTKKYNGEIKDIIRQDIVSTSDESQSSSLENASKLTT